MAAAFSSTVDAVPTTGKWANRQRIAPGLYRFSGTWDSGGVTAGTVDLTVYHVTKIKSGMFSSITGTGITEQAINYEAGVGAADGKMAVITCTAGDTGTWEADCEM